MAATIEGNVPKAVIWALRPRSVSVFGRKMMIAGSLISGRPNAHGKFVTLYTGRSRKQIRLFGPSTSGVGNGNEFEYAYDGPEVTAEDLESAILTDAEPSEAERLRNQAE